MVGFLFGRVGDAHERFAGKQASDRVIWCGAEAAEVTQPLDKTSVSPRRDRMEGIAVKGVEVAMARLTQAYGLLEHCIEDGGEVAGRGIDDLQYFGSRG